MVQQNAETGEIFSACHCMQVINTLLFYKLNMIRDHFIATFLLCINRHASNITLRVDTVQTRFHSQR
jgi:hypothetical protein